VDRDVDNLHADPGRPSAAPEAMNTGTTGGADRDGRADRADRADQARPSLAQGLDDALRRASGLPADDALRTVLHNEVHARPSPTIRLPALVVYVAVLNDGVERGAEWAHLCRLPGQEALPFEALHGSYLRLDLAGCTLKWERHTEYTRYTIVQPLPAGAALGACDPELTPGLGVSTSWVAGIPGRTIAAIKLGMAHGDLADPPALVCEAQRWFGSPVLVASVMGRSADGVSAQVRGHSCAFTDFRLRPSGYERWLVVAPPQTTPTRAGRILQRLLELETYRLMALRGLPAARALTPLLNDAEPTLAGLIEQLEAGRASDQQLLGQLVALAARLERGTAQHDYRFAATRAYDALVAQRIAELRESAIPGTQTIGEFMQRRLDPAIATVAASAQRLSSLSQRVERASALLRTRVDIAAEAQNQELLARLARGQALQLRLQSTVEGLSIAAISYYVVSLLIYGVKAAKAAGIPLEPEIAAGALVPLVLWAVWRTTRRIHERLHADDD
jgi:uncharacterized membrane-anchored protein